MPARRCLAAPARGLVAGVLAISSVAPGVALAQTAPAACRLEEMGTGVVRQVADGRTFTLDDGREARLAAIEVPSPGVDGLLSPSDPAAGSKAALEGLISGQTVTLKRHGAQTTDRYGRLLAYVFLRAEGLERAVQHDMLALGLARVAAHVGDRVCAAELLAREREARAAGRGLWADPDHAMRRADNPAAILGDRGRFALVEGSVLSVRDSGGTIYMNFGRRWSEDFTVTIAKRNERMFSRRASSRRSSNARGFGCALHRGARRPLDRGQPPRADRDSGSRVRHWITAVSERHGNLRAMRKTRQRYAPLAAVLALLTAECTGMTAVDRQVALPDPPKQAEPVTPAQREHQRILAAYGGSYADPKLEAVLKETVDKLVASSERPDLRYRVTILNSPAVNAFALPTGNLYVTRGLLALANDTSELASVLSHEMAHVIARHAAIREDQARQAAIVSRVVNDVLADPQMGALALAKSKIALATFSRTQELEADGIGVGIAARAGYDPYGATRFLTAMGRNAELKPSVVSSNEPRSIDFLSSHPSTPDRVKNALSSARQQSAPGSGVRDKENFLAATDGLPYGEDPSEGFVRGRRFLHPKLGFTFTAPDGFVLDNTALAVLGIKDNGSQALRVDVVRVPADQKLGEYLVSGWIDKVDPRSVEEMNINGFPAAAGTAKGEQWAFRLYVLRFGSDVYRFVFAAKQKTAETDRVFRDSVNSFRRMSVAEIEKAQPLRIKSVTVASGDTIEKLASHMATDKPVERFLVLNGLTAGQALRPGDQVKVVTE